MLRVILYFCLLTLFGLLLMFLLMQIFFIQINYTPSWKRKPETEWVNIEFNRGFQWHIYSNHNEFSKLYKWLCLLNQTKLIFLYYLFLLPLRMFHPSLLLCCLLLQGSHFPAILRSSKSFAFATNTPTSSVPCFLKGNLLPEVIL